MLRGPHCFKRVHVGLQMRIIFTHEQREPSQTSPKTFPSLTPKPKHSCMFDQYPGRAPIHVFNNPSMTKGYLSWDYSSNKLEFFTPYQYI